jgi:hypothetical protein
VTVSSVEPSVGIGQCSGGLYGLSQPMVHRKVRSLLATTGVTGRLPHVRSWPLWKAFHNGHYVQLTFMCSRRRKPLTKSAESGAASAPAAHNTRHPKRRERPFRWKIGTVSYTWCYPASAWAWLRKARCSTQPRWCSPYVHPSAPKLALSLSRSQRCSSAPVRSMFLWQARMSETPLEGPSLLASDTPRCAYCT